MVGGGGDGHDGEIAEGNEGGEEQLLQRHVDGRQHLLEAATAGRQDLIVVASLIDRVPNLAGLARTCEVRRRRGRGGRRCVGHVGLSCVSVQ